MPDEILLSNVSYITPLGRPPIYFSQWENSELAPPAIRRMSVPPHRRPELKCHGQNSSPAERAAPYPTWRAASRDCGGMVRGLARRRRRIMVSQPTATLREPLPDRTGNAENPAPAAGRHRGVGGSDVLCRAMQLHAVWYMSAMTRAVVRLNPPPDPAAAHSGEPQLPLDPIENTGKKPGEPLCS